MSCVCVIDYGNLLLQLVNLPLFQPIYPPRRFQTKLSRCETVFFSPSPRSFTARISQREAVFWPPAKKASNYKRSKGSPNVRHGPWFSHCWVLCLGRSWESSSKAECLEEFVPKKNGTENQNTDLYLKILYRYYWLPFGFSFLFNSKFGTLCRKQDFNQPTTFSSLSENDGKKPQVSCIYTGPCWSDFFSGINHSNVLKRSLVSNLYHQFFYTGLTCLWVKFSFVKLLCQNPSSMSRAWQLAFFFEAQELICTFGC